MLAGVHSRSPPGTKRHHGTQERQHAHGYCEYCRQESSAANWNVALTDAIIIVGDTIPVVEEAMHRMERWNVGTPLPVVTSWPRVDPEPRAKRNSAVGKNRSAAVARVYLVIVMHGGRVGMLPIACSRLRARVGTLYVVRTLAHTAAVCRRNVILILVASISSLQISMDAYH